MSRKVNYLDFASILSAIAVVILHTNRIFWTFSATERYWVTANFIDSFFYFAVPVFFMISGATLLNFYNRYGIKEFLKKRAFKTLIPYLFWSFFAILFTVYYLKTTKPQDVTFSYVMTNLLTGRAISIYWFFIPLFCIYLAIPLFAAIKEEKRKEVFSYIALVGFILNVIIPFINKIFKIDLGYSFTVGVVSGYLLWVVLGYLLHNYELNRRNRCCIYFAGAIGLLLHIFGTYYSSLEVGTVSSLYKGYNNLPCVLQSVAAFVFIKQISTKLLNHQGVERVVHLLRDYTFSLYLIHYYLIDVFVKELMINEKMIIWRLGGVVPIFIVTILITYVLRRIKIGKWILP